MVAIYVRQSIDKKDSLSIESQIETCQGHVSAGEEYEIYSDKGATGKNTERVNFQRMMADIERGVITKIIIYRLDRISRSVLDFSKMYEVWEKHNVSFISHHENFDTTTPMGKAMLQICVVFAELEHATILERVTDNYYARAKQGFYLGGHAPFGFNQVPHIIDGKKTAKYEADPEMAAILLDVYREYAYSNITLGKLARKLTNSGVRTKRNDTWTASGIARVLRSAANVKADAQVYNYLRGKQATMNNPIEHYIGEFGCYIYAPHKSVTTRKYTDLSTSFVTLAPHRGIVPADLWLKCQIKLDANNQITCSGSGTHTWLSGIMKCGYCKYSLTVVNNNRGRNYVNCYGRKKHVCDGRKRAVRLEQIEQEVERIFMQHLHDKYMNLEAPQEPDVESPAVVKLKNELAVIESQIATFMDDVSDPETPKAARQHIYSKIDSLQQQYSQQQQELTRIQNRIISQDNLGVSVSDVLEGWASFDMEQRKEVARIFLEKVFVTDNSIDLLFK